jgi:hypothetical protein
MQFHSVQMHETLKNGELVRERQSVNITNGKGTKTFEISDRKGTRRKTKKLTKQEITNIKNKKFMPGFFSDCKNCLRPNMVKRSQTKKKRGH